MEFLQHLAPNLLICSMAEKNSMRNDYDSPSAEPKVGKNVLQEEGFAGGSLNPEVLTGRWFQAAKWQVGNDHVKSLCTTIARYRTLEGVAKLKVWGPDSGKQHTT